MQIEKITKNSSENRIKFTININKSLCKTKWIFSLKNFQGAEILIKILIIYFSNL